MSVVMTIRTRPMSPNRTAVARDGTNQASSLPMSPSLLSVVFFTRADRSRPG